MAKKNEEDVTKETVGYQRPPSHSRFAKGRSGNPRGRPKGRLNMANLLKATLEAPVCVRDGDRARQMPCFEAMVRTKMADAMVNPAALMTVFEIYKMTGRAVDVTDEERAKRTLRLPAPPTPEEYELLKAPAREKDRQRALARAEADPTRYGRSALIVPRDIVEGDERTAKGDTEAALAAYAAELDRCKAILILNAQDEAAQKDFRRGVARMGLLADKLLSTGKFRRALEITELALTEAKSPFWTCKQDSFETVTTNFIWIQIIRAHAQMLLGQDAEARTSYLNFQTPAPSLWRSWETSILRDFRRLEKRGYAHPLMAEIEARFGERGWTADTLTDPAAPTSNAAKAAIADDAIVAQAPDPLAQGPQALEQMGKLEEAAAAYSELMRAALAEPEESADADRNALLAKEGLGRLAWTFLDQGRFALALECGEQARAGYPDSRELLLIKAEALMFLGRTEEARDLLQDSVAKNLKDYAWQRTVLDSFTRQRALGRPHPLMDEVEAFIKEASSAKPSAEELAHAYDWQIDSWRARFGSCDERIAKFAHGQFNLRVLEERNEVVQDLYRIAQQALLAGNFSGLLAITDCALEHVPNAPIARIYRAHALLFLERSDEAIQIYQSCRKERLTPTQTGKDMILENFALLRTQGFEHRLMLEMESGSEA